MPYPGGKNGAGVYQIIINLIPPHSVYIEPFLGGGAIMRLKQPALLNIGCDLSANAIAGYAETGDVRSRRLYNTCGIAFLQNYDFTGGEFIYCDPPYMHSTRGRLNLYEHEMTDVQHAELLSILCSLPCKVMVSGYWTKLYADALHDWTSTSFEAMTRAGHTATEWLWFNYPKPTQLHDYSYLGEGFRERERIKRKKLRWVSRLRKMPMLERQALLAAMDEVWWDPPSTDEASLPDTSTLAAMATGAHRPI